MYFISICPVSTSHFSQCVCQLVCWWPSFLAGVPRGIMNSIPKAYQGSCHFMARLCRYVGGCVLGTECIGPHMKTRSSHELGTSCQFFCTNYTIHRASLENKDAIEAAHDAAWLHPPPMACWGHACMTCTCVHCVSLFVKDCMHGSLCKSSRTRGLSGQVGPRLSGCMRAQHSLDQDCQKGLYFCFSSSALLQKEPCLQCCTVKAKRCA